MVLGNIIFLALPIFRIDGNELRPQIVRQHDSTRVTVHPAWRQIWRDQNRERENCFTHRCLHPINKVKQHKVKLVAFFVYVNSSSIALVVLLLVLKVLHTDNAELEAPGCEYFTCGCDHTAVYSLAWVEAICLIEHDLKSALGEFLSHDISFSKCN